MTGCSGKGGSGDGTDGSISLCSTPLEASLSDGLDRIGGATTSVALVDVADTNWTLYNNANELHAADVSNPLKTAGLEVEGYIHDIETVKYGGKSYALLAMGEEGITVVDVENPLVMVKGINVKVNYEEPNITIAEGSGSLADINISSSRAPISSLAVYNEGSATVPNWQLIIGDEGYGLHKTSLDNLFDETNGRETDGTLLIDGPEQYTLQYAGESPWGGPKSLTLYGEGNSRRLFVAQGFMGMGIYDPRDLTHVGHYNLYTDATEDNNGEDWFYDMNISAIASTDSCTGMPDYLQASAEINGTTTSMPWADFEFYGKYYYNARNVDVAKVGSNNTYAYIAYGLAGLVAVDVSDYNTTTAECGNTGKYLGYVPAMPVKGPTDRLIGNQGGQGGSGTLFSRAGAGMLKDAGVVDVKVDANVDPTKVFFTDHFGGLMVVNYASTPDNVDTGWHGPDGLDAYDNDMNKTVDHIPSYDFVTSYDMSPSSTDEEALPTFTIETPILLATGEVGGHGNSLALTGNSFDENDASPADVVMAAGAGGLNFIEVYGTAPAYDFNVTEHFATTDEIGAAPVGLDAPEISVGHSAGVGTYENILYLADGPHGVMAWKVADISGGTCQNIATEDVGLVGNTLQSESAVDVNGTMMYPTPHADEVVVINNGGTKSAMVASLSAGLRRVNVNNLGTDGAPELLYPTDGDIFEHSIEENKLGGIDFEDRVYDVAVRGNLAFTADGLSGVTVYDLNAIPDGNNSDIIVANIKGTGEDRINNATGIALSGDYAFVAGGSTGITVIDISNTSNLSIVKTFQPIKWEDLEETPKAHNADGVAVDVKIMGEYVFFTYDSFGVLAYRISDLIDPTYDNPLTKLTDDNDDRPNAVGYFKIQNAATYTNNVGTDFSDWGGGAAGIEAISATNGKKIIYVAYGDAGVVKLDWTNLWTSPAPTGYETIMPVLEDHANTAGKATDVVVWNGRVYVADGAGGLVLLK